MDRFDLTEGTMKHTAYGTTRSAVAAGLWRRVCGWFEELEMLPGPSRSARLRAAMAGYVGPLAWDAEEIDDPVARPMAVPVDEWARRVVARCSMLRRAGLLRLADELGFTPEQVELRLRRAGELDLAVRFRDARLALLA